MTLAKLLRVDRKKFNLVFKNPKLRPPVLEEMYSDINKVIAGVAMQYRDDSHYALNYDALCGEGRACLATLIDKGKVEIMPTREEFFKYLKASINNRVRSLVEQHRFTIKRTGVKPPPRKAAGDRLTDEDFKSYRSVEVSIDDPDSGVQVEDLGQAMSEADEDLVRDIEQVLLPAERVVLRQLIEPNEEAHLEAHFESARKNSSTTRVRLEHLATGLGLSLVSFKEIHSSVKIKVKEYLTNMNTDDSEYNSSVRFLEKVFGVHVPPTTKKLVVRRMMTLAARDQYDKVDEVVVRALEKIKAHVPKGHSSSLSCFGILHDANNRLCKACGMQASCKQEAENVGLEDITMSPRLNGAKNMTRIPAITPHKQVVPDSTPHFLSERDEEVYSFLCDTYEKAYIENKMYFRHKDLDGGATVSGTSGILFCIQSLRFRFCKPHDSLKGELEQEGRSYYLPEDCSYDEAVSLLNAHAENHYAKANT